MADISSTPGPGIILTPAGAFTLLQNAKRETWGLRISTSDPQRLIAALRRAKAKDPGLFKGLRLRASPKILNEVWVINSGQPPEGPPEKELPA